MIQHSCQQLAQHAEAKCQKSIWDELPNNAFTVGSVDNFDMLQSHSAVYCGDQQCSFHGTTLQLVQPSYNIRIPPTIHPPSPGTQDAPTPLTPTIHPPSPDFATSFATLVMADKETLSTQPSVIHVDRERPETIGSATTHTRNPIRDKWCAKMELPDLEAKAVISACSSGRKLS